MQLYAGLDLHSRNTYIGIMDKEFKRVFGKRVSNNLPLILKTLDPFQDQLEGIVVESTFNWYWLIDGLMDAGYHCVHLANLRWTTLHAAPPLRKHIDRLRGAVKI